MTDIKQFKHCENLSPLHTFVRGTTFYLHSVADILFLGFYDVLGIKDISPVVPVTDSAKIIHHLLKFAIAAGVIHMAYLHIKFQGKNEFFGTVDDCLVQCQLYEDLESMEKYLVEAVGSVSRNKKVRTYRMNDFVQQCKEGENDKPDRSPSIASLHPQALSDARPPEPPSRLSVTPGGRPTRGAA